MKLFPVKLISPGRGSSGFYPVATLREAATDKIFGRGTKMFWNHDTASQRSQRPVGDMERLAAVLTEDATYIEQGIDGPGLYSAAMVFSDYEDQVEEKGPFTGLSIVAEGDVEFGEIEGFKGPIIRKLTNSHSVDFVTKPGRDGRVLFESENENDPKLLHEATTLLEAANVGDWFESRIHLQFTTVADNMFGDGRLTREERIALSGAIGDALNAFRARVEADAPQLFLRNRWQDTAFVTDVKESLEEASKLGDFLKRKRDELKLTNDQLARAAGIDVSTMQSILSGGINRPPDRRLRGLARLLKTSFNELIALIPANRREESQKEKDNMDDKQALQEAADSNRQLREQLNQQRAQLAVHEARRVIAGVWDDDGFAVVPVAMRNHFAESALANLPFTDDGKLNVTATADAVKAAAKVYVESLPNQSSGTGHIHGNGEGGATDNQFIEAGIKRLETQHKLTRAQAERAYYG